MNDHQVFLSHSSTDNDLVEELARELARAGITPWFDKWDLEPGRPWLDSIEQAIERCKVIAVCVGPSGLRGLFHQSEMAVAIEAAIRDGTRRVIPVLLPGAEGFEALPPFLRALHGVDLRGGITSSPFEAAPHAQLRAGRGPRPCPYRGLEPFYEQHAKAFYGRSGERQRVLELLRERRPWVLVSAGSGAGKSSLLRAGVIPAVRTGELADGFDWHVLVFRPGAAPLRQLAIQLLGLSSDPVTSQSGQLRALIARFSSTPDSVADHVEVCARAWPESRAVMLVVDHLEDLFAPGVTLEEAQGFLQCMRAAGSVERRRIQILGSVRRDFLDELLRLSSDSLGLSDALYYLPPMARSEIVRAVREPALDAGISIEHGLAERLADDVRQQPGGLPMLQWVLFQLFDANPEQLTHAEYDAIGQLGGAIARKAETILQSLGRDKQLALRLLVRLVAVGSEHTVMSRAVPKSELLEMGAGALRVIDYLVETRLLVVGHQLGGQPEVELAHVVLVTHWPTLRARVDEDREEIQLGQLVHECATRWIADERHPDHLWRGRNLRLALKLLHAGHRPLSPHANEFIAASQDREQSEGGALQVDFGDSFDAVRKVAAGFAHEVNNFLAGVSGNLEFLTAEMEASSTVGDNKPSYLEALQESAEGVERIRQIAADVSKTFGRGSDASGAIEVGPCLEVTLRIVGSELRRIATVRIDGSPTLRVHARETQLAQVFINLLTNAAQALANPSSKDAEIRVRSFAENGFAVIEIQDSGPGIPEQLRARVFEPFFSTKAPGSNTGLGLSISRDIVERFGGTLELDCPETGGTVARVRLPLAPDEDGERAREDDAQGTSRRPPRLLVVDDEPMVLHSLRRALGEYDLTAFPSATQAIEALEGGTEFDVVLSDLMMPGMDGFAFYDWVCKHRPTLAAHFVFFTGGTFTDRARAFLQKHERPILQKPVGMGELRRLLTACLAVPSGAGERQDR